MTCQPFISKLGQRLWIPGRTTKKPKFSPATTSVSYQEMNFLWVVFSSKNLIKGSGVRRARFIYDGGWNHGFLSLGLMMGKRKKRQRGWVEGRDGAGEHLGSSVSQWRKNWLYRPRSTRAESSWFSKYLGDTGSDPKALKTTVRYHTGWEEMEGSLDSRRWHAKRAEGLMGHHPGEQQVWVGLETVTTWRNIYCSSALLRVAHSTPSLLDGSCDGQRECIT